MKSPRRKRFNRYLVSVVLMAMVGAVIVSIRPDWIFTRSSGDRTSVLAPVPSVLSVQGPVVAVPRTPVRTDYDLEPRALDELLDIPADQLHRVDVARMNLLCASGLAETQDLDIDHAVATLDAWAHRVAFETDRHLYRVTDPRYAGHYGRSEAQFRAEMLAQVLQEDLKVKYDTTMVGSFSFANPAVAFIHGMIPAEGRTTAATSGGTCASMPVLYIAVGRRLGYPLKLATTDSHVFARWDGLGHENPAWRERFNCEVTQGFNRFDDGDYRRWPKPVTDRQIAVNGFLESLTAVEELAQFIAARGHHGTDVGEFGFAARCFENACRYDRRRPSYRSWFLEAAVRTDYQARTPALARLLAARRSGIRQIADFGARLGNRSQRTAVAGAPNPGRPRPWGTAADSARPLSPPVAATRDDDWFWPLR